MNVERLHSEKFASVAGMQQMLVLAQQAPNLHHARPESELLRKTLALCSVATFARSDASYLTR